MNNTLEVLTPLRVDAPFRALAGIEAARRLVAPDGRTVAYVAGPFVDVIVEALENYDHRKYTEEDMDREAKEAYEDGYDEGYDEAKSEWE
jgi:hypothetical protein